MKIKKINVGVPCTACPSVAVVILKCRYNEKKSNRTLYLVHGTPTLLSWFIMLGTVRRVCALLIVVVVVLEQGWSVEMQVYFVHPSFRGCYCCSGMGVVSRWR